MSEKLYKIGQAAALLNLNTSVLRFWETVFPQLAPRRTDSGQRFYTEEDMALLRRQVQACLPGETALHEALRHSASVREALLSIPEGGRLPVLHGLARAALEHFSRRAPAVASLHLLVFDFDGAFLFKESLRQAPGTATAPLPLPDDSTDDSPKDTSPDGQAPDIGLRYFIDRP